MIKRKARFATIEPTTSNKAICQNCYENQCITKLVEYKPDPSHFMVCPYCGVIVDKSRMRYPSVVAPLGYVGNMEAKYEAAVLTRSRSRNKLEQNEVPLLAGKPDTDLESLLNENNGILVSVTDDYIESSEDY